MNENKHGGPRPGAGRPKTGNPPRTPHLLKFTDQEWEDILSGAAGKEMSSREYISWLVEKEKSRQKGGKDR